MSGNALTKKQRLNFSKGNRKKSEGLKSVAFLLPASILLLIFFISPMVMTVFYSFTNLALTGAAAQNLEFVGFQNFIQMFQDPRFQTSVYRTLVFLFFSAIVGQCFLGFLIAFLMREKNKHFRRIVGITVIAAWVTPEIVAAFNWVVFLGEGGTANWFLGLLGFEPIAFMFAFPMISVIIANVWRGTAFSMMVFQAALDDISKDIEEAAAIDGANRWHILWNVTIPMVKGTIGTNMMLVTLQTLGVFTLIFTMTGGGPGDSTMTLPVFMYQQAFVSFQLGYGTAISLVLLLMGAVFSLIYMKFLDMKV